MHMVPFLDYHLALPEASPKNEKPKNDYICWGCDQMYSKKRNCG